MKPFASYPGGKESSGTYQKIINEIRPHTIFVSGFLGNCAVLRYKKPALRNIGIDLDKNVIEAWQKSTFDNVKLILGNSLEILSQLVTTPAAGKTCVYLDPPYRFDSRKRHRKIYNCEMTDDQHLQFLQTVLSLSNIPDVDIIVSHYPDSLYDEMLKDWRQISFQVTTRGSLATEKIYMNYQHTTGELHQYDFLGDNKDERYNLKNRIVKKLIKKIENYEPRKKQAVLHYMKELLSAGIA